jgi:hypothetical protein
MSNRQTLFFLVNSILNLGKYTIRDTYFYAGGRGSNPGHPTYPHEMWNF